MLKCFLSLINPVPMVVKTLLLAVTIPSPCSIMHFHLVGHWCYCTEGYLNGGTHIICGGNEGVTFYVSFQNQYPHLHTNSMLCPLNKRRVKQRERETGGHNASFLSSPAILLYYENKWRISSSGHGVSSKVFAFSEG